MLHGTNVKKEVYFMFQPNRSSSGENNRIYKRKVNKLVFVKEIFSLQQFSVVTIYNAV
jgi:hypothetical protein